MMAGQAINNKIDGRELTRNIEQQLNLQLGKKASEKFQREVVWEFIKELAEGIFEEEQDLVYALGTWVGDLNGKQRGKQ